MIWKKQEVRKKRLFGLSFANFIGFCSGFFWSTRLCEVFRSVKFQGSSKKRKIAVENLVKKSDMKKKHDMKKKRDMKKKHDMKKNKSEQTIFWPNFRKFYRILLGIFFDQRVFVSSFDRWSLRCHWKNKKSLAKFSWKKVTWKKTWYEQKRDMKENKNEWYKKQ